MMDISIYFSKVPRCINDVMPGEKKYITCLSYYSYYLSLKANIDYNEFDYICIDGIFVQKLHNLVYRSHKTPRISVDMTSLVPLIFDYAINNNKSIYFLGAKEREVEQFVKIINLAFPKLIIAGYRNGYFDSVQERLNILKNIIEIKPAIIFIGTGAPLQDQIALELKHFGYEGTAYTCGGFIHQTQNSINYYPKIVDKLNLRLFYRFYKEKNILKKVFPSLFVFLYHYCKYLLRK